jgi:hypothetical protein
MRTRARGPIFDNAEFTYTDLLGRNRAFYGLTEQGRPKFGSMGPDDEDEGDEEGELEAGMVAEGHEGSDDDI